MHATWYRKRTRTGCTGGKTTRTHAEPANQEVIRFNISARRCEPGYKANGSADDEYIRIFRGRVHRETPAAARDEYRSAAFSKLLGKNATRLCPGLRRVHPLLRKGIPHILDGARRETVNGRPVLFLGFLPVTAYGKLSVSCRHRVPAGGLQNAPQDSGQIIGVFTGLGSRSAGTDVLRHSGNASGEGREGESVAAVT